MSAAAEAKIVSSAARAARRVGDAIGVGVDERRRVGQRGAGARRRERDVRAAAELLVAERQARPVEPDEERPEPRAHSARALEVVRCTPPSPPIQRSYCPTAAGTSPIQPWLMRKTSVYGSVASASSTRGIRRPSTPSGSSVRSAPVPSTHTRWYSRPISGNGPDGHRAANPRPHAARLS